MPKSIRQQLSITYLLARTSDTIADELDISAAAKIKLLDSYLLAVKQETPHEHLTPLLLAEYKKLNVLDKKYILDLLAKIITAQKFDTNLVKIKDKEQLDWYIYHVAGCVGEYITNICYKYIPGFSKIKDKQQMINAGINYGKGLQLINILRDIPEDKLRNREYLPDPDLEYWKKFTLDYLEHGKFYINNINNFRVKYAFSLPYSLGIKTLNLVNKSKISRGQVYLILLKNILFL